jgi:hypothetical protein
VPSAALTTLYTSTAPPAPKPQPSALSRPPNSNNNWNKNNNRRNGGGNGGKNNSSGGGRGGNSGNTIAASTGSTNTEDRATSPWPTYVNPWQGNIAMYTGPVPMGQQCLQAFLAVPGHYTPPGFMPGQQQQPLYQHATPILLQAGHPGMALANSFSTMTLQPPPTSVQDWVTDSGASPSAGNISKPQPLN